MLKADVLVGRPASGAALNKKGGKSEAVEGNNRKTTPAHERARLWYLGFCLIHYACCLELEKRAAYEFIRLDDQKN